MNRVGLLYRILRSDWAAVSLIIVVGGIFAAHTLVTPAQWPLDGLYYRAQMLQLLGHSQASTIQAIANLHSASNVHLLDPNWIQYSQQFYRRRWLVPGLAALLYPAVGDHALVDVSVLGYLSFGVSLFFLLRTRFDQPLSLFISLATMGLPELRTHALAPYTDAMGLALEALALLALIRAIRLRSLWSGVFLLSMLAIGFTREGDASLVAVPLVIAILKRSKLQLQLAALGLVAFVPLLFLRAAPLNVAMRYAEVGQNVPADVSWGTTLHALPHAVYTALHYTEYYLHGHLIAATLAAIGLTGAYLLSTGTLLSTVVRLLPIVYVATIIAAPVLSDFRYELVLLPTIAVGLALVLEKSIATLRRPLLFVTPRPRKNS